MKASQLCSLSLFLHVVTPGAYGFLAQVHQRNFALDYKDAKERTSTTLAFFDDFENYEHQPLSLSESDLRRIQELRQR